MPDSFAQIIGIVIYKSFLQKKKKKKKNKGLFKNRIMNCETMLFLYLSIIFFDGQFYATYFIARSKFFYDCIV